MFFTLFMLVCGLIAAFIHWNYSYWERKNFPYVKAKIPFGVLDSVRRRERSFGMAIYDVYTSSKEKVLGIYLMTRPAVLVRDASIARDILSKDFSSFHDRGIYVDDEHDPMSSSLFALRGQKWKSLRTKLTPTFTSGKLKAMFSTVEEVSNKMVNHLNTVVPDEGSKELELKRVCSIYAVDIIASVIFGLDVDTFLDPKNEFFNVSQIINKPTGIDVLRGTCQFMYPSLEMLFQRLGWAQEGPEIMRKIVHRTIKQREENNIVRKDMLQLLLQLRNSGEINADDNVWSVDSKNGGIKNMSPDVIAAQLFLFYVAGFETTASAIAFTIHELSQHPDILAKAQEDIETTLAKYDGQITYDAVQNMKYLDLCLKETIRKYPGLPILNRECTIDYKVPDTELVIKKGTPVVISLFGINRDPKYFPNPEGYEPERFLEENYDTTAYMPFGDGPRHCIAQRMGTVNAKVALVQILTNFNVEINKRCEIEIANYGIPIMPKGGINVRLSKKVRSRS